MLGMSARRERELDPRTAQGNRVRGGKAEKSDSGEAGRRPPVPDPDNAGEGRSPRRPFSWPAAAAASAVGFSSLPRQSVSGRYLHGLPAAEPEGGPWNVTTGTPVR